MDLRHIELQDFWIPAFAGMTVSAWESPSNVNTYVSVIHDEGRYPAKPVPLILSLSP